MWNNFFQGTEAVLAKALEHANFPQSEEEQALRKNETQRDDKLQNTMDDDETTNESTNETAAHKGPKEQEESATIANGNDSPLDKNQKGAVEKINAWFDENENGEEPTLDNWFSIPTLPVQLPVDLPSVFSKTAAAAAAAAATTQIAGDDKNKNKNQSEILETFQTGWDSLQKAAQEQISEAQRIFQDHLQTESETHYSSSKMSESDLARPLDLEALRDVELSYLTDRIITMSHPMISVSTSTSTSTSQQSQSIKPSRKVRAIAHLLQKRHATHYMIWNLSEIDYDYSAFEDNVIFSPFPGSPCPPLGHLLKLILSIDHWLKSSPANVAIFHCLTGKGRTATLLACFLAWKREAGFDSPLAALEYIANCKQIPINELTIPSQRRYISYFAKLLEDGMRPKVTPVLLKRIIMSGAPRFDPPPSSSPPSSPELQSNTLGCAPYLQIFKGGKLIFTTAAFSSNLQDKQDLPFFLPEDGPVIFPIELEVQGDILFRCRHLSKSKTMKDEKKISMFRAAFHTGFVETTKVLRFTKAQLDGIYSNESGSGSGGGSDCDTGSKEDPFEDNFFLDLVFESCMGSTSTSPSKSSNSNSNLNSNPLAILPSKYDSILYKESFFWDFITSARKEFVKEEKSKTGENLHSHSHGPTVGQRRNFNFSSVESKDKTNAKDSDSDSDNDDGSRSDVSPDGMFGFEFIENLKSITTTTSTTITTTDQKGKPSERCTKDDLMKILMTTEDDDAKLAHSNESQDDDENDGDDEDEIIFESNEDDDDNLLDLNTNNDIMLNADVDLPHDEVYNVYQGEDDYLEDMEDLENFLKRF